MELLREKRTQAKMWLEKLKRSFVSTTNRNTRKTNIVGEKMSYNDMKAMVLEGEQLYDDGHRELNKAVDAIDSAEEVPYRTVLCLLCINYSSGSSEFEKC